MSATSLLPRVDRHRPRGTVRPSRRGVVRALVLVGVHVAAVLHIAHWKVAGSSLSPLEPSEAKETLELGYVNAGFVLFALLILATLVVGRFFCGWACHVVAYQDASAWLLGKLGLRPRAIRSRALMAVPFLAAFDMFLLPTLFRLGRGEAAPSLSAHFVTTDLWASFPGPTIALLTFAVDGFLLVWFLGAKGFCTNACPYGAFFGVAQRVAPGRIRASDACEGCGHCTSVCTSNVRVHEEVARYRQVVDPGCMRCMDCVSACPTNALSFSMSSTGTAREAAGPLTGARRAWDFSWGQEVALAGLFLFGLFAFRGLYARVPLMLALGLGVLFAGGTFCLARMARARDLQVQRAVLVNDGRWTRTGRLTAAALLLFTAFTVHSAVIQTATRYGAWALMNATDGEVRGEAQLRRGAVLLAWSDDHGLLPDARVVSNLGMVDLDAGRYAQAAGRFREAIRLAPRRVDPHLGLAEASMKLRELEEADRALDTLLELEPTHVRGRWRRAQIAIMRRDFAAAESLLETVLRDAPEHARARADLDRVRAMLGR